MGSCHGYGVVVVVVKLRAVLRAIGWNRCAIDDPRSPLEGQFVLAKARLSAREVIESVDGLGQPPSVQTRIRGAISGDGHRLLLPGILVGIYHPAAQRRAHCAVASIQAGGS
jgi:hypothetical protein